MKRKVKVILTAAIFTFCTAIGGCKAVESKLEPVYEALLQEDSVQEEKSVQASENQEMSTKEDLSEKESASVEDKEKETVGFTAVPAGTVTVEEANSSAGPIRLARDKKILLTGDSRTVCLYCSQIYDEAEYPKHVFYNIDEATFTGYTNESIVVAKGGEGCSWMRAVGIPNAVSHLEEADALVIWFGVNDLHVASDYINYVNGLVQQYDIPIYYMTIGPCNGHWEQKNSEVLAFNSALTQMLDPKVTVIDAYGYIKKKPYGWRLAVDKNTSKSRFKMDYPKIIPMYAEPDTLELGVTEIQLSNVTVRIFEKERLICECLKYEDKMDRERFKEGLMAYIKDPKKDIAKLMYYAKERKVVKKVQNMIGVWL